MKRTLALLLALVMCSSLCACGNKITPEMIDAYKNANVCLSQGRYAEAAKLYLKSGKYEDTDTKLREIYYYAVNCYEEGKLDEAYSLFEILKDANINDSAKYSQLLNNHFSYEEALNNAKHSFFELHNVYAGYDWLDKAATYATEQQKAEIEAYRQEVSYTIYADTEFVSFDTFLSENVAKVETKNEEYSYYSYRLNGREYDAIYSDFKVYYSGNYTSVDDIPRWAYDILPEINFVYYDNLGNMIAWDYSLTVSSYGSSHEYLKKGTDVDVYVFYADFVKRMNET